MIQSAFESLTTSPRFHQYAVTLMQVSLNVLQNPREAVPGPVGNRYSGGMMVEGGQNEWRRSSAQ